MGAEWGSEEKWTRQAVSSRGGGVGANVLCHNAAEAAPAGCAWYFGVGQCNGTFGSDAGFCQGHDIVVQMEFVAVSVRIVDEFVVVHDV